MIHKNCLEALDRTLQDIMSVDQSDKEIKIFGKKTMLLRGGFRQILPVVQYGTREDIINACISKSHLWKYCRMFILNTNMRLRSSSMSDSEKIAQSKFAQWILDIGDGKIDAISFNDEYEAATIEIPEDLLLKVDDDPLKTICNSVYKDFHQNFRERAYL